MIVVIVILSIVGLMVFSFLGNSMASYMIVKERDRIYDEGLMAMERMTREIKDARYDGVTYLITNVTNTSVTFTRKHATRRTPPPVLLSGETEMCWSGWGMFREPAYWPAM